MKLLKTFCITLIFGNIIFGQIGNVDVKIESDQLEVKERTDLRTLEIQLPSYFEGHDYTENKYDLQIPIKISIFAQSANTTGSERKIKGQLFIMTTSGDQRFFEKNFRFIYGTNEPLVHSQMIYSLPTIMDFYALMIIAGEMDTYEPLGGNNVYEKARDLASRAEISDYPHGWSERLKELNEIINLRYYRLAKCDFWTIIDLEENEKTEEIPKVMQQFLDHLNECFTVNARERHAHIFLDAQARDIADLFRLYGTKDQQAKLLDLDPDNKKIYNNAFK